MSLACPECDGTSITGMQYSWDDHAIERIRRAFVGGQIQSINNARGKAS